MDAETRLQSLGITLPAEAHPVGLYRPAVQAGSLLFLAGQVNMRDGQLTHQGKLGRELEVEAGRQAARQAALNALGAMRQALGSLNRVRQLVQTTVYVASAEGFTQQPQVANGASELFRDVFGEEAGVGARAAVGLTELPLGAPVEIVVVVQVAPE